MPKTKDTSLQTHIAAGTQIDIVLTSIGSFTTSVYATGAQYDLTDLMKKHQIDLNRFEPASIEILKNMGGLYGLPVKSGGLVLYYNKDIFDKFGVTYPKDGMYWDDVIELSKQLTRNEDGVTYLGLSVFHTLYSRMNSFSLPMIDPKTQQPTYDNELWKKVFQTILIEPSKQPEYMEYITKNKLPPESCVYGGSECCYVCDELWFK